EEHHRLGHWVPKRGYAVSRLQRRCKGIRPHSLGPALTVEFPDLQPFFARGRRTEGMEAGLHDATYENRHLSTRVVDQLGAFHRRRRYRRRNDPPRRAVVEPSIVEQVAS